jgi:hypothetical protein
MRDQILEYCEFENNVKELFIPKQFDDCLLGICHRMDESFTTAYDLNKIIVKIMKKNSLTYDEAIRNFNLNILDKNPTISFILITDQNQDLLSEYNNKMLFLDGFDDNSIIGVRIKSGCNIVAAYDDSMCIQSLIDGEDMDETDAIEFFEYNTRGSFVGNDTPAIVTLF